MATTCAKAAPGRIGTTAVAIAHVEQSGEKSLFGRG
jgi:hypothetical protein